MLVQTQKKSKSQTPLLIVLGIIFIITGIVVFRVYFTSPDIDVVGDVQLPTAAVTTTFDTSVLQDVRFTGLRQYGAATVDVVDRGRKPDPFQAF